MRMKKLNLTGQKFGRLTVLNELHNYHKKGVYWLCKCECGNLTEVKGTCLTHGHTKSCGCLNRDITRNRNTIHGAHGSRLYTIWQAMKDRCYNVNFKRYKDYGGRGVAVCDEWKNDFKAFHDWAKNNGYADNLSIDRIDVNGNYEPNNCRFITLKQQNRNRRSNINVNINGVTKCLTEWCETLGVKYPTALYRIHHNWSVERALELEGK